MKKSAFVVLACLAAGAAWARPLPTPPPSGKVVHLFGPDSVLNTVVPGSLAGAPAARGGAAALTPAPRGAGILHQMFISGDRAQENGAGIAKGRAMEH